jgi:hypothetical protein
MNFLDAEAVIRSYIETQWAISDFSDIPLVFENEPEPESSAYMGIYIEGTYSEKGYYGGSGKKNSVEAGIVFIHGFTPTGEGKSRNVDMVVTLSEALELRTISSVIDMDGANPPSPVYFNRTELDRLLPPQQPKGNYYLVSGSVPFIIRSSR